MRVYMVLSRWNEVRLLFKNFETQLDVGWKVHKQKGVKLICKIRQDHYLNNFETQIAGGRMVHVNEGIRMFSEFFT